MLGSRTLHSIPWSAIVSGQAAHRFFFAPFGGWICYRERILMSQQSCVSPVS